MQRYYINDFKNKDIYIKFISFMVSNSDTFSLVYFRHNEAEKYTSNVEQIERQLSKHIVYTEDVTKWPGTYTLNVFNHIYKLAIYKCDETTEKVLEMADSIFEWDYPEFPMDLCFYKNGYSWFASSSHENWNALYINNKNYVLKLRELGVEVKLEADVDENEVFYNEHAK